MSTPWIERLFAHLAWADERTLEALQDTESPDPSWVDLFAHLLAAEHAWISRVKGETPKLPMWPSLTLKECDRLAHENRKRFQSLLHTLDARGLKRTVHYRNSAGAEFDNTVEDILLHVALHGSYHRGQIAAAMRRGGAVPLPTDYIAFVRGAPAPLTPSIPARSA
ncbi:MAG: DinB family protein [Gemmatimonadota bacterium]